jgi:hypothetical protein
MPTVAHPAGDRMGCRCDRFYAGLPASAMTDAGDCSGPWPVTAAFDLDAAVQLQAAA